MKRLILNLSLVCFVLTSVAFAAEPPKTQPDSSKWDDVFKADLSNAIAPEGIWTFEDGILTASEDQCIWTKKIYDNFTIDLEFKTADGTNSGVIVYASDINGGNWIPNSLEIQIADDYAKKWADSAPTWQCAAVFGRLPASKDKVLKKAGEWNRMTITCIDNMIYVMLNGKQVNVMDMKKWTDPKVNPDGSPIPPWLSKPAATLQTKGHIGLQGKHAGAPIYFRNLKIKEIK